MSDDVVGYGVSLFSLPWFQRIPPKYFKVTKYSSFSNKNATTHFVPYIIEFVIENAI